ncbi:hypothetical protein QCA50_014313 [Cerrena zonata]|uniref:Uncharacterized protein n=1 Tax=Cerrena zonata TaxID=2478898 RepID=A0AAW0FND9_9APHY
MQFNLSKFLVALVITAACANAATITERGADSSQALLARVWVNPDRGGDQLNIQPAAPLSGCVNFVNPFVKSISSLEVFNGVTCSLLRVCVSYPNLRPLWMTNDVSFSSATLPAVVIHSPSATCSSRT